MGLTKFYHYNLWIEGDDGRRLNPSDVLSGEVLGEDLYRISNAGGRNYHSQFQEISNGQYHGVLIRTKDEDDFVRLSAEGQLGRLSDATEDSGEAGDLDYDYVDFAIDFGTTGIDLLIEVGFQTPGIGVLKQYLDDHIEFDEEYELKHETDIRDLDDEKLERLLDSHLKRSKSVSKRTRNLTLNWTLTTQFEP